MEQSAMNDLPQHVHDERNGLDYTLHGDYYLPDLELPKEQRPIGRWGRMRLAYLKERRPGLHTRLILSGKLGSHLADVDEQAEVRFDVVMDGNKRLYLVFFKARDGDALNAAFREYSAVVAKKKERPSVIQKLRAINPLEQAVKKDRVRHKDKGLEL